jgi:hypothetical protein
MSEMETRPEIQDIKLFLGGIYNFSKIGLKSQVKMGFTCASKLPALRRDIQQKDTWES